MGIEFLTRYMAQELGHRQIVVNTVAPGAIETDFGGGAVRDNLEVNQYSLVYLFGFGNFGFGDRSSGA